MIINDNELKNKIYRIAKNALKNYKIMFMYFGGSLAYGSYIPKRSDIDVNVVVDGLKGYSHINIQNMDFFIYGKEVAMKKQKLTSKLSLYYKTYIDEVLEIGKTHIFLDDNYKDFFEEYKNINLEERLTDFLRVFTNYHEDIILRSHGIPIKRLHHIIRMKGILENYIKTKKYALKIDESYTKTIKEYKIHYNDEQGKKIYENDILPAFLFVKEFLNKIEKELNTNE